MMLATLPATCEECRNTFPPQEGGICVRCGRLLCGWHLHGWGGSLRQLFRAATDADGALCRRCAGERPSDTAG